MDGVAHLFIGLGLLFLLGLAADRLGHRTRLPRVTLLLACGMIVGQPGLDLVPDTLGELYPALSVLALSMLAFLLGGTLSIETLSAHGRAIVTVSLTIVIATLLGVAAGLWLIGLPLATALLLGAIATATDPAATYDVISQSGRDTAFTRTLKGIVAIDDAWGLLAFSLVLAPVVAMLGMTEPETGAIGLLWETGYEIGGSILLGAAVGLPAAYLTGRLSPGEPLRIEALGLVFLTAGLALYLDLSYLLAGMTAGAVIVNLARHHTRAFHEIEGIQWPFMMIFFLLAGAGLDLDALWTIGPLGLAYVALRTLTRIAGGWLGASLGAAPRETRPWFGPALLPQAGVAIGMALIAAETLPEQGELIMALAVGTTVLFELLGPLVAGFAIARADRAEGDNGAGGAGGTDGADGTAD